MEMNMHNDRGHILAMLNVKRDEPLEKAFGDIYENSPHTFLVPNLRRLSKEIGREIEAKYPRLNDLDSFKTYAELNTYVTNYYNECMDKCVAIKKIAEKYKYENFTYHEFELYNRLVIIDPIFETVDIINLKDIEQGIIDDGKFDSGK